MYYVITRNSNLIAITLEDPHPWNLPEVSIHVFNSAIIPDINIHVWDDNTETLVQSTHVYSKLQFLNLFTTSERIAIRASQDPIIVDFLNLLSLADYIDDRDTNTISAINYFSQLGLITAARAAEILA